MASETFLEMQSKFLEYLASEGCDMQKVCRLCLYVANEDIVSLFQTMTDGTFADKLQSVTSIEVVPNEDLAWPYHICKSCVKLLIASYKFKKSCVLSNSILKSVLRGEYVKEDLTEDEDVTSFDNAADTYEEKPDIKDEYLIDDVATKRNSAGIKPKVENVGAGLIADNQNSTVFKRVRKTKDISPLRTYKKRKCYEGAVADVSILNVVKKEKLYGCSLCDEVFPKSSSLEVHIQLSHSESGVVKCKGCKESFTSERDHRLHLALHQRGGKWTCAECHKEFVSRSQLKRHISRHMENKKHKCEFCTKTFSEHYALRRHRRVHTGELVEKKHACQLCSKRFSETALLRVHMRSHTGERPNACPVCHKTFPSPRHLASHMLVHDENKPHQCHYCDKRFRHESTRNVHLRTHTGERPYVCATCGKAFLQHSNLNLHMRTHSGEKPYQCKECGRRFTSGSSLKTHQRIHTGEKPYSCEICGKRFARVDMRTHLRRHAGARPHECTLCRRRFYTTSGLREHRVAHSGEKSFECSSCHKKYATKSHLLKHIKSHKKKTNSDKRKLLIVHRVTDDTPFLLPENIIVSDKENLAEEVVITQENTTENEDESTSGDTTVQNYSEPIDMRPVNEDGESPETNLIVVEGNCLAAGEINFLESNVNLITVSRGETSLGSTHVELESTTLKLYQIDQSSVQIQTSGSQVTINKITSKMTANFS